MHTGTRNTRAAASALTLLVAVAMLSNACRGDAQKAASPNANQTASAQPAGGDAPADISKLNGDIERLEKQAERNPADEETQDELARAYVRRAKVEQGAGQHQEALADYQRALRHDPDNDEAQSGAAAATEQLGGGREDEHGAPAPLPITPNVADEEGKPTPTATPKKP